MITACTALFMLMGWLAPSTVVSNYVNHLPAVCRVTDKVIL